MKFAVILAGCGAKDGSEIHEATLALYAIAANGGAYEVFAPDIPQYEVVNHLTGEPEKSRIRNVLTESARIARGNIRPLSQLHVKEFDALLFPGGFGAAKNLFSYGYQGMNFSVRPDVEAVVAEAHQSGKVIGAMCIAPVMIAKLLGRYGVTVTVGPARELAEALHRQFGAKVEQAAPDGITLDRDNKVVTTPAYMYGDSTIDRIGAGADALVKGMMSLAKNA